MPYTVDQIDDLKNAFGCEVEVHPEGPYEYVLIRGLKMPAGCTPEVTDVLLCPVKHHTAATYETRLFFKDKIDHPSHYQNMPGVANFPNWQQLAYQLGHHWHNYSYTGVKSGTFVDMVINHLRGLTHR